MTTLPLTGSTRPDSRPDSLFVAARLVSLVAALGLVAQSEWTLALAVGWPSYVAWLAPVALDSYVLAAIRSGRDLGASVIVSTVSVLASHALYANPNVWVGPVGRPDQGGHLTWKLAAVASVVPLIVMWRTHKLPTPIRAGQPDVLTVVNTITEESDPSWWDRLWSGSRADSTPPTPDPTPDPTPEPDESTPDPDSESADPTPARLSDWRGRRRSRVGGRTATPDPDHVARVVAAIESGELPTRPTRDAVRLFLGCGSGPARAVQQAVTT